MLPQIVQQRQSPLECLDVFAHNAFFASGAQRRSRSPAIQGKDGGRKVFFRDARARGFAKPELSRTMAQSRQASDGCDPANEL